MWAGGMDEEWSWSAESLGSALVGSAGSDLLTQISGGDGDLERRARTRNLSDDDGVSDLHWSEDRSRDEARDEPYPDLHIIDGNLVSSARVTGFFCMDVLAAQDLASDRSLSPIMRSYLTADARVPPPPLTSRTGPLEAAIRASEAARARAPRRFPHERRIVSL
uniref:Uncharacterized protein n=1 Tax=Alexandrium monilatum TaxID=311494 RepID=A0A7S4QWV0_9DINO|mmetsp:Transcript_109147/g.336952  ORF Transcript_109147/g.336952 Transcript_109147/m.336952 type:complete len:164 (+) Transcript_109147:50-541(+)